ncbi:DUF2163 domain-containing protein [Roseivivax sediminis]|uniref:Bacteriophage phiJL001 Gp84 C-terminal domain-containing protein n=1 Tax=Roseivivax sediminis TaxID=936889 RepID=A0A1I1T565_9RHOB|nr:DUF2163 domain-containing protein [Roseivivax sediminis]SFD53751.1 phage conserved hypothetical protein BR0599 [Roseivivax sediminis]
MSEAALHDHLETGLTTVARAWEVNRTDGVSFGFTDHDRDLTFAGRTFRADSGLTALALQQGTGLSVDNTEALGALSADAITEADIEAGRFDDAEVVAWLVNWADTSARKILFRGFIGEIRREEGAFHAELRGLAEKLNRPIGRVYQAPCTAVLGDAACGFDFAQPGYLWEGPLASAEDGRRFSLGAIGGFDPDWFRRGRFEVLEGPAAGLFGWVKRDETRGSARVIELWEPIRAEIRPGDRVRVQAGCDKRMETCRLKFNNLLNFQGFPDIPGEDWLTVHPTEAKALGGGSRR